MVLSTVVFGVLAGENLKFADLQENGGGGIGPCVSRV